MKKPLLTYNIVSPHKEVFEYLGNSGKKREIVPKFHFPLSRRGFFLRGSLTGLERI